MNHPTQLNIFTQGQSPRELKIELPKPRIADFRYWRDGDLLDMVELTCELVKSGAVTGHLLAGSAPNQAES